MIKKFIIKSNEWYEGLPKVKGELFYLSLIFIPYLLILFLVPLSGIKPTLLAMSWMLLVAIWRVAYSWIIDWDRIKNKK